MSESTNMKTNRVRRLSSRITRRQAIKAGGIASLGFIFSKPLINTLMPSPAWAQVSPGIPNPTPTPTPSACIPVPPGAMSWWTGDDNANDRVNGNHGILRNGATFSPGFVGQAFSLNGGGAHVEVPDSPSLDITGAISVEVWVRPNTLNRGAVVTKHNSNTGQVSYGMQVQPGGLLEFFVSADGTTNRSGARTKLSNNLVVPTGLFTHVAATFSPVNQDLRLYANGEEVASSIWINGATVTSIFVGTTPVLIGSIILGGGSLGNFFGGLIDEPTIYDRVLAPNEIRAIFEAGVKGKCKV